MSATEKGQVITANRLRDGLAVFMTHAGSWSDRIDDAVVALEPEAAAALELRAKADEKATLVTGSYLVDAERRNGHVWLSHIRERMRTQGPTVRRDLGKQAEGLGGAFAAPEGV
jgi:hypothetical protein